MSRTDLFDDNYFEFLEDLHLDALNYVNNIIKSHKDEIYVNNFEVGSNGTYLDWYKIN